MSYNSNSNSHEEEELQLALALSVADQEKPDAPFVDYPGYSRFGKNAIWRSLIEDYLNQSREFSKAREYYDAAWQNAKNTGAKEEIWRGLQKHANDEIKRKSVLLEQAYSSIENFDPTLYE